MKHSAIALVVLASASVSLCVSIDSRPERMRLGAATVASDGAHTGRMVIALAAIGRETLAAVDHPAPHRAGNEVHITRARGVTEWWRTAGEGLEQGVTIDERPIGAGALVLEMTTGVARVEGSADALSLRDATGAIVGTYSHLAVRDVTGELIDARLVASADRIRIEVDDARATYPIVVDPLVIALEATLATSDGMSGDRFGSGVAISADGAWAVVGEPLRTITAGHSGTVSLFSRTGSTWSFVQRLADAATSVSGFGGAVSISDDGTVFAVANTYGAPDPGPEGSMYRNVGGIWTRTAIPGCRTVGAQCRMTAIDVSGDGAHVVVATLDNQNTQTVQIYAFGSGALTLEASVSGGTDVSIDQSGTRVAVSSGAGLAGFVMVRSGSTWSNEASVGPASGSSLTIAISGDGTRVVQGCNASGTCAGVAWVRSGSTWTQEQTLPGTFRATVAATSADGSRVLLGTYATGAVHIYERVGTSWTDDGPLAGGPYGSSAFQTLSLDMARDGQRMIVGNMTQGANGAGTADVFTVLGAVGARCSATSACGAGIPCVDGVCCENACGGGSTTDCRACSSALTGVPDGMCAALSVAVAPTVTCRPSAASCDVAETCASGSTSCPTDVFVASTTVCRPSAGSCDVAEYCTGSIATCPVDVFAPGGGVCRPSAGVCDVSELCTGISASCPANAFAPTTQTCRFATDLCDAPETCSGAAPDCPVDALQPTGHVCRPAGAGMCDPPDTCTGVTTSCPSVWASATTVCDATVNGVCDAPDLCSGSSATCVPTFASGVVCRAAAGACDVAESCSGTAASCPPDAVEGAGTVCRASTAMCDPAESCSGSATSCPPDVSMCAPMPDAGAPDGGSSDAGHVAPDAQSTSDAASPNPDAASASPPTASGCACRVGHHHSPTLALLGLALLLAARKRPLLPR